MKHNLKSTLNHTLALALSVVLLSNAGAADKPETAASPTQSWAESKPADMTKPVKVFILLGQSNMVGLGAISRGSANPLDKAVKQEKMYPFLIDEAGNWAERKDVRNVFLLFSEANTQVLHNEWLQVGAGSGGKMNAKMGTEYGIGHLLGNVFENPVMLLKCCNGNKSIGYDLLTPGSKGYDFVVKDKKGKEETYTYAGYNESPTRWLKGTKPEPVKDKANPLGGWQYNGDIGNAKKVLAELDKYYPGAKGYEVAGFLFWQGEKDSYDPAHSAHYEENLVNFIKQVRKDFNAPNAKFVLATLGECIKGMSVSQTQSVTSNRAHVLNGHLAVDGESGKYPEFKNNVATIYTHPLAQGGEGNAHYGKNSKVYMDVGLAMGQAMLKLLKTDQN